MNNNGLNFARMMTPEELLNLARTLNPEKLKTDRLGALIDAYNVGQALDLAIEEDLEGPFVPPELAKVQRKLFTKPKKRKPKELGLVNVPKGTLDQLRRYLDKSNTAVATAADQIGVSRSALDGWLKGRFRPTVNSIAKIEAFLHGAGHYE